MQITTSIRGVVMPLHPAQGIRDLKKAGFESALLDLNTFCKMEDLWPGKKKVTGDMLRDPEKIRAGYQSFLDVCIESGMSLTIGQLPNLMAITERKDLDDKVRMLGPEGVQACESVGCKFVIAPPLFAGVEPGQEWESNLSYYLELAAACEKRETMLLLTNQCKNVSGHLIRGNCAEAEEALAWIKELNGRLGMERFGFCLDVGVCNICGQDMREMAVSLGAALKAVIVRDNDGQSDDSLLPFTCSNNGTSTDWLSFIRGLREIGFDGDMIISYGSTAESFSPLIRPVMLNLAKEVADYFVWQLNLENAMKRYDSIVLFGAGNMCRNYMKNYGKKYPPLFTCDNGASRWGEMFCGLEIKPPEVLRDLPDNCAVFICNIYYREIEQQLRDLGVKNIEYFNDEYMPSFHMDRLEAR